MSEPISPEAPREPEMRWAVPKMEVSGFVCTPENRQAFIDSWLDETGSEKTPPWWAGDATSFGSEAGAKVTREPFERALDGRHANGDRLRAPTTVLLDYGPDMKVSAEGVGHLRFEAEMPSEATRLWAAAPPARPALEEVWGSAVATGFKDLYPDREVVAVISPRVRRGIQDNFIDITDPAGPSTLPDKPIDLSDPAVRSTLQDMPVEIVVTGVVVATRRSDGTLESPYDGTLPSPEAIQAAKVAVQNELSARMRALEPELVFGPEPARDIRPKLEYSLNELRIGLDDDVVTLKIYDHAMSLVPGHERRTDEQLNARLEWLGPGTLPDPFAVEELKQIRGDQEVAGIFLARMGRSSDWKPHDLEYGYKLRDDADARERGLEDDGIHPSLWVEREGNEWAQRLGLQHARVHHALEEHASRGQRLSTRDPLTQLRERRSSPVAARVARGAVVRASELAGKDPQSLRTELAEAWAEVRAEGGFEQAGSDALTRLTAVRLEINAAREAGEMTAERDSSKEAGKDDLGADLGPGL